MKLILWCLLLWAMPAFAYPQFVKDGYFSCSTCHVSQAGGDTLTPYGRTMAEQKLAMKAFEGEGQNTWSASKNLKNLILSGHFRRIQIFSDNEMARAANIFNMQRDVDAGFWTESTAGYATWYAKEEDEWELRKWILRSTPWEHGAVAVGAFRPKYGLNLNDHNAFVVSSTSQQIGNEQKIAEAALFGEAFEVTLSQSLGSLPDRPIEQEDIHVQTATLSWFLAETHRVSANAGKFRTNDKLKVFAGFSGTFILSPVLNSSLEVNSINEESSGSRAQSLATYLDLVWEPIKGVWVQPFHEVLLADRTDPRTKIEKQGLRLSLFPRPHFDVKATMGQTKDHSTYIFRNFGSVIFHFWL